MSFIDDISFLSNEMLDEVFSTEAKEGTSDVKKTITVDGKKKTFTVRFQKYKSDRDITDKQKASLTRLEKNLKEYVDKIPSETLKYLKKYGKDSNPGNKKFSIDKIQKDFGKYVKVKTVYISKEGEIIFLASVSWGEDDLGIMVYPKTQVGLQSSFL